MPENSFLLFDSNLLHMNEASSEDVKLGWNRRAAYICMMPKKWRKPEVYAKKVRAYLEGNGTSHWACFCDIKPKPQWPRKRFKTLNELACVDIEFECSCEEKKTGNNITHTEKCIPQDRRKLF